MLRIVLAALLGVHGLIHILGFLREWNLAPVKGLSGATLIPLGSGTAKVVGLLWLLASLTLSTAAAMLGLEHGQWLLAAGGGLGLSQALIVLYWKDAWAGTLLNLVLLAGCALIQQG